MNIDNRVSTLPVALALCLPAGAFGMIPLLQVPIDVVLLLLMALCALRVGQQHRLLRPPFEHGWPIFVLLLVVGMALLHQESDRAVRLVLLAIAFLTPQTLAANATVACRAITAFGAACGANVLMHGAAERLWIPPTVVFAPADILLAGPDSFSSGLLLSVAGMLANLVVLTHPAFTRRQHVIALGAAALTMAWWAYLAFRDFNLAALIQPTSLARMDYFTLSLAFTSLWLVARVMARSLLMAKTPSWWRGAVLPTGLGLLVVLHLVIGTPPTVAAFFLLGLAAALDAPWSKHRPHAISHPLWALPLALVLIQLLGVLPLTEHDPRNQIARGERLFAQRAWAELDANLSSLRARRPTDPNYSLLQARSYLTQRWPKAAVDAYCSTPSVMSPASPFLQRNERAFLDDLRDMASAQPPGYSRFDFERALAHHGDRDQVRNLLEIRRGRAIEPIQATASTDVLRRALTALLGAAEDGFPLATWSDTALESILRDGGVVISRLGSEVSADVGPLLLVSHRSPTTLCVAAHWLSTGTVNRFEARLQRPAAASPGALRWQEFSATVATPPTIRLFSKDTHIASLHVDPLVSFEFLGPLQAADNESVATVLYVP